MDTYKSAKQFVTWSDQINGTPGATAFETGANGLFMTTGVTVASALTATYVILKGVTGATFQSYIHHTSAENFVLPFRVYGLGAVSASGRSGFSGLF